MIKLELITRLQIKKRTMKKLSVFFSMLAVAAVISVNLTSCGGDDPMPMPTVRLLADVDPADQYNVILTVDATDATSYSWTYGDGETSTVMGSHSYKYAASGDYEINVVVTNESGTASAKASVTINPSLQEMIAGVDPNGKTWVMSKTPSANDGAGPLAESAFDITLPFALIGDALAYVGFPDEYDNAFTFKPDGSYEVDNGNGVNLCTQIFATIAQMQDPSIEWTKGQLGFATMPWAVSGATWEIEEDATIALDIASDDPATPSEYTEMSVSYTGVTKVNITNGYFGILDLTNNVFIENIAPDKMQVVIIMHTENPEKQSIFSRITLIPQ